MSLLVPMGPEATIASRVRALRTKHNLTQRQLANRLGVDPMTVSRWERGEIEPSGVASAFVTHLEMCGSGFDLDDSG